MFLCFLKVPSYNFAYPEIGHVGAPLPCNLIKLVDVAEKNYFASKGEGEVSHSKCPSLSCSLYFSLSLLYLTHPLVSLLGVCEGPKRV